LLHQQFSVYSFSIVDFLFLGAFGARAGPGFPGLRYRFGPAFGAAAPHPSNPLRKTAVFGESAASLLTGG
jgi:hypothetical protein